MKLAAPTKQSNETVLDHYTIVQSNDLGQLTTEGAGENKILRAHNGLLLGTNA
jgi:hypothetical protein